MTAAEKLRRAAEVLREWAEAATPGPWSDISSGTHVTADHPTFVNAARPVADTEFGFGDDAGNSAFIATMNPTFALAVADWLDEAADDYMIERGHLGPATARIADAILAGVEG